MGQDVEAENDIDVDEIPGGLYAVPRFKGLDKMRVGGGV